MQFGLNLYSLRNQIKTEDGLISTLDKLKRTGYSFVQFSGAPFDADVIRRATEKTGVPVVLTHAPIDRIIGDTDRIIGEHLSFGCKNIGLGTIPWKYLCDKNDMMSYVDALSIASKKINEKGLKFFYHNHHVEFFKHDEKMILDILLERIPSINFTLDIYWAQYGGADVMSVIKKLSGRIGCVHLKDYMIKLTDDGKFVPDYAPLGEGSMDLCKIIPAMRAAGTEYFFVEMDNATDRDDPFDQIIQCAEYLKNYD